jgi:hypothetical protein
MTVSVTLRQETDILDEGYRILSEITVATPEGMRPLFVLQPGIDPWEEVYTRVADLDDLNKYVFHPLNRFQDSVLATPFSTAVTGDKLIITSAVPIWMSDNFTEAKFDVEIAGGGGAHLFISADKLFPYSLNALEWELWNAGETSMKANGTDGYTSREDPGTTDPFLRWAVTNVLGSVEKASSRAEAIKTGIESVVTAANTHGPDFEDVEIVTYE